MLKPGLSVPGCGHLCGEHGGSCPALGCPALGCPALGFSPRQMTEILFGGQKVGLTPQLISRMGETLVGLALALLKSYILQPSLTGQGCGPRTLGACKKDARLGGICPPVGETRIVLAVLNFMAYNTFNTALVQKPEPVSRAEQMGAANDAASASASMGDSELVANIVAYQVAVKRCVVADLEPAPCV
eukprot:1159348-Pelagomonas_calceolata.AAC.8